MEEEKNRRAAEENSALGNRTQAAASGMSVEEVPEEILRRIQDEAFEVTEELSAQAKLEPGSVLIVGCSTSEVASHRIGSYSNVDLGRAVFEGIRRSAGPRGIFVAAQCCEHLNRAVIIEKEAAVKYGFERVNVVPVPKAGGSFATAAYEGLKEPVAVEEVAADAGIDIGDTLIGMHLKKVAVPVRIKQKTVGGAHVVCARTRYKFVGGSRACYDEDLL